MKNTEKIPERPIPHNPEIRPERQPEPYMPGRQPEIVPEKTPAPTHPSPEITPPEKRENN
jgi:hypothetical protein